MKESSKSSIDKINMLSAMGAQVHVCPANVPASDSRSYYEVAKRLHSEIKDSIYINQYFNEKGILRFESLIELDAIIEKCNVVITGPLYGTRTVRPSLLR